MCANVDAYGVGSAMYAGTARDLVRSGVGFSGVQHVRAHAEERGHLQSQRYTAMNGAVDLAAKAVALANSPSDAVRGQYDLRFLDIQRFLRAASQILSEWPKCRDFSGDLEGSHEGQCCHREWP